MAKTDIISDQQAQSLYGLFCQRAQRSPQAKAYQTYCNDSKQWLSVTWHQVATQVACWQDALAKEELKPGDHVALNLRNCLEWVLFDQAALGLGLIVVPLYPDDRPDNVAYILQDANVKLLFLQNAKQWTKLEPALTELALDRVIINNLSDDTLTAPAVYTHHWLNAQENQPAQLRPNSLNPDQLASIIYTSGTTGRPKGVMLSHQNMLSVAYGSLQYINVSADDVFLSFLPLSHTLERTIGYYLAMMAGATVAYSRGIPQLAEDMLQVKPTVLIAVPRIFERIYNRLHSQLATKPAISKQLFKMASEIGWQRFLYQQNRSKWQARFLLWPLLNSLVSSKVHNRLGGNIRLIITGGAAISQPVSQLFIGLGFCLVQGYGLTETSPVISVNKPGNNFPASVGQVIPGVRVKVGDNDELLVNGPGNMLGYWNNSEATAHTIDDSGWLHTGDQARISDSGHIYITGRIKDILVLSNGEKVPPADIESAILIDDLFEQVLVVGEGQAFLAALLIINNDNWPVLAKHYGLDPTDPASLNDKSIHNDIVQRLKMLLFSFPAYAKIRRVSLSLDAWTIENGLMTATMKIKRPQVIKHHQADINNMYQ